MICHRFGARWNLTKAQIKELHNDCIIFSMTDGASYYNNLFSRFSLRVLHLVDGGPRVAESCISIAGDGKTALDRFFAEVGSKIRAWLNARHDAVSAADNVEALAFQGQLKASVAATVEILRDFEAEVMGEKACLNRGAKLIPRPCPPRPIS